MNDKNKTDPWSEYYDEKVGKSEAGWDYRIDSSSIKIDMPDGWLTTGSSIGITGSSSYITGGLVYITDGNSYSVTTDDGTTVELDAKGNCIKINGYKITTETIKNAIKKIQEETTEGPDW